MLFKFYDYSLPLSKTRIDFCLCVYDFAKFTYSNSLFVDFLGLFNMIMSSANKDSLSCHHAFYFFFLLYYSGTTSSTVLNKSSLVFVCT